MEADECEKHRFSKQYCIIPNSVDLQGWHRDEAGGHAWRKSLDWNKDELVCLYVGRLHHKKGLDLLPETFSRVGGLPWRMIFVGADEDGTRAQLERSFVKRGFERRVKFLPAVEPEKLPALYSAADVFLMPSRHENFGNVAIEAMACGCHVIASESAGVAEFLEKSRAAQRLPRTPELWAEALRQPFLFEPIGQQCAEKIQKTFSAQRISQEMEIFYARIAYPSNKSFWRG